MLSGIIAERVREIIRQVCKDKEVEIVTGHIRPDHIHLLLSFPPHLSVSGVVKELKGKSSWKLMSENKMVAKQCWGRHFWGRGYFAVTVGSMTEATIKEYIEKQEVKGDDEDFKITGD